MKKIWITGAEGHIGSALVALLDSIEYQILTTDINEVDITDINEVNHYMQRAGREDRRVGAQARPYHHIRHGIRFLRWEVENRQAPVG